MRGKSLTCLCPPRAAREETIGNGGRACQMAYGEGRDDSTGPSPAPADSSTSFVTNGCERPCLMAAPPLSLPASAAAAPALPGTACAPDTHTPAARVHDSQTRHHQYRDPDLLELRQRPLHQAGPERVPLHPLPGRDAGRGQRRRAAGADPAWHAGAGNAARQAQSGHHRRRDRGGRDLHSRGHLADERLLAHLVSGDAAFRPSTPRW